MQKFTGHISHRTDVKAVPKIWEVHHDTGKYIGRDGKEYSSKLSVWVPKPRNGEHRPGIFIRLANPNGFCYTRLDSGEFAELYTFIRTMFARANQAYEEAEADCNFYREAERALAIKQGRFTEPDTESEDST